MFSSKSSSVINGHYDQTTPNDSKKKSKLSSMSLKRIKLRLGKLPGRSISMDGRLSILTSRISINENSVTTNEHNGHFSKNEEISHAADCFTPIKLRHRTLTVEDVNKRLSLPAYIRIPEDFILKQAISPTLDAPLNRRTRKASLSEIGFGKIQSYNKLEKLGEGTYASVYRGVSKLSGEIVALKEIRLEHDEGAPCTAIREVSLLRDLRHANIVTLHDIIYVESCLTLVFEYLELDLKQYMEECVGILNLYNVKLFLFQLLRGLTYCHARRILHRDLKPPNLLINQIGELKLADFGLARAKSIPSKTYSNEVVTLWYRPPDILLGSTNYSTHIDLWGVGCIFAEMSTGKALFPGSAVEEQLHLIIRLLGSPSQNLLPNADLFGELATYNFPRYPRQPLIKYFPRLEMDGCNLLFLLLQFDGMRRISAAEALKHPYFICLGQEIHKLSDTTSIFSLPFISLAKDPGRKLTNMPLSTNDPASQKGLVF